MKRQDLKALKALAVILLGALTVKITVWPLIADIKFKSGLKAMSLMEYEKAESDFKIAINYRKEPVYYENLAALYRTMGETAKDRNTGRRHYEQSVYFYKKLLELNPGNSLVYNGLGATCLYIGKDFKEDEFYRSAIDNFKKALDLKPGFVEAELNLATAYYLWGLKAEAVKVYENLEKDNPDNISARFNLGLLYFMEKDYTKAEQKWRDILKIAPENIDAQKGLEMLNKKRGEK